MDESGSGSLDHKFSVFKQRFPSLNIVLLETFGVKKSLNLPKSWVFALWFWHYILKTCFSAVQCKHGVSESFNCPEDKSFAAERRCSWFGSQMFRDGYTGAMGESYTILADRNAPVHVYVLRWHVGIKIPIISLSLLHQNKRFQGKHHATFFSVDLFFFCLLLIFSRWHILWVFSCEQWVGLMTFSTSKRVNTFSKVCCVVFSLLSSGLSLSVLLGLKRLLTWFKIAISKYVRNMLTFTLVGSAYSLNICLKPEKKQQGKWEVIAPSWWHFSGFWSKSKTKNPAPRFLKLAVCALGSLCVCLQWGFVCFSLCCLLERNEGVIRASRGGIFRFLWCCRQWGLARPTCLCPPPQKLLSKLKNSKIQE